MKSENQEKEENVVTFAGEGKTKRAGNLKFRGKIPYGFLT